MNRLALSMVLLVAMAHPLPAPIFEKKPATPKPATPKPKPKPAAKPKSSSPPTAAPAKRSRFVGSWVGTMPTVPWGNVAIVLTVNATETTMGKSWNGSSLVMAKAQVSGDTISATFPALEGKWSLTPQPDGKTARVRLQALMNDQSAVFHRTVEDEGTKTPR